MGTEPGSWDNDRVVHAETELGGTILRGRYMTAGAPDYAGDMCGRWVEVLWDDGFMCWVPAGSVLFDLAPALTLHEERG